MKETHRFPLRLLLVIFGQRQGSVHLKTASDYKRMRRRGFSRPIQGITYFNK